VEAIHKWEKVVKIVTDKILPSSSEWENKAQTRIKGALKKLDEIAKKTKRKKKVVKKEKITAIDPEGSKQQYFKGLIAYGQGKIKDAISIWEFALRLDPNNEKAKNALTKAKKELEAMKSGE